MDQVHSYTYPGVLHYYYSFLRLQFDVDAMYDGTHINTCDS